MRFLMLTTFYPPYSFGGDAAYIERLSKELGRRGHSVDVVHCADAYHLHCDNEPAGIRRSAPGVTVHTLRSNAGWLSPLLTQQTGRAGLKADFIRDLVSSRSFDVIHYHNMSLVGLDAMEFGDAVKLYTTHEHWLVCPTHALWKNNQEACQSRACFTCQIRSGRPPQWWRYSTLLDRCSSSVDCFLAPSRFTMAKHRELGFDRPMLHLPYFLTRSDYAGPRTSPHPRPYALVVGRLEKLKGVQNTIRAFRDYRGCDLVIVGDGAYEKDLRQLARGRKHIHFLGRLPYEEIRTWYRHALALVVPSICYEVFGIVVLEAFAVRTPVLVTPMGALPEIVEDSGGGMVYRTDAELVDRLTQLQKESGLRDWLGCCGYGSYVDLWSEEPHMSRYFGIIKRYASVEASVA